MLSLHRIRALWSLHVSGWARPTSGSPLPTLVGRFAFAALARSFYRYQFYFSF